MPKRCRVIELKPQQIRHSNRFVVRSKFLNKFLCSSANFVSNRCLFPLRAQYSRHNEPVGKLHATSGKVLKVTSTEFNGVGRPDFSTKNWCGCSLLRHKRSRIYRRTLNSHNCAREMHMLISYNAHELIRVNKGPLCQRNA